MYLLIILIITKPAYIKLINNNPSPAGKQRSFAGLIYPGYGETTLFACRVFPFKEGIFIYNRKKENNMS